MGRSRKYKSHILRKIIILIIFLVITFLAIKYFSNHPIVKNLISTNTTEQTEEIIDDSMYLGEFLDLDFYEPELTVEKIDDDKYKVFMGIYRLTQLNGIGELTKEGLTFTATDMAGNPISAIINAKI